MHSLATELERLADEVAERPWMYVTRKPDFRKAAEIMRRAETAEKERDEANQEAEHLWRALEFIASMPTSELNPDGVEQAAHSMRHVACVAIEVDPGESRLSRVESERDRARAAIDQAIAVLTRDVRVHPDSPASINLEVAVGLIDEATELLREERDSPDYSHAYQDEYQRLWHEAAQQRDRARAAIDEAVYLLSSGCPEAAIKALRGERDSR